jgi:hypothetical protein
MAVNCTCQTLSECISLDAEEFNTQPQLLAVLNPANGLLTIILPAFESDVTVYNSPGAVVAMPMRKTEQGFVIDVTAVTDGVYYARVISGR